MIVGLKVANLLYIYMVLIDNLVQVFYTILTHISHFRYIDDEVSSIDDINWGLFTALFIFVQICWAMLCNVYLRYTDMWGKA